MLCSICVATYKRPFLLEKLLNSLYLQNLPQDINIEIIVVDNDIDKSAISIVCKFNNSDRIKISYYNQPVTVNRR